MTASFDTRFEPTDAGKMFASTASRVRKVIARTYACEPCIMFSLWGDYQITSYIHDGDANLAITGDSKDCTAFIPYSKIRSLEIRECDGHLTAHVTLKTLRKGLFDAKKPARIAYKYTHNGN